MTPFILFAIKSLVVSGAMLLYYGIVLKNKKMYSFNRYFLLFTALLSVVLPFVSFSIASMPAGFNIPLPGPSNVIIDNTEFEPTSIAPSGGIGTINYWLVGYLVIVAGMLTRLIMSVWKISKLNRSTILKVVDGIEVVETSAEGAPFTFFKTVYWHSAVDINSQHGTTILEHELVHAEQLHSIDLLFLESMKSILWFNPFYYLLSKELKMVHEFIADDAIVQLKGVPTLAATLIFQKTGFTTPQLTNSFFHSPIKRRIKMANAVTTVKQMIFSKLMVVPLLAIVFLITSFTVGKSASRNGDGTLTIVVDAGHGGNDAGAVSKSGLKEKDITLRIAQMFEKIAPEMNVKVKLIRTDDVSIALNDRLKIANDVNGDVFVSVHIAKRATTSTEAVPIQIIQSSRPKQHKAENASMANAIDMKMKSDGYKPVQLAKPLLMLNDNNKPSVIIECGDIDEANDLQRMTNNAETERFCKSIVKGIVNYQHQQTKK